MCNGVHCNIYQIQNVMSTKGGNLRPIHTYVLYSIWYIT